MEVGCKRDTAHEDGSHCERSKLTRIFAPRALLLLQRRRRGDVLRVHVRHDGLSVRHLDEAREHPRPRAGHEVWEEREKGGAAVVASHEAKIQVSSYTIEVATTPLPILTRHFAPRSSAASSPPHPRPPLRPRWRTKIGPLSAPRNTWQTSRQSSVIR